MGGDPDFDPNNPVDALDPDKINRVVVGTYEMGSTYKALTLAMAMDSGKASINSQFDARTSLRYGKFEITPMGWWLWNHPSFPEMEMCGPLSKYCCPSMIGSISD